MRHPLSLTLLLAGSVAAGSAQAQISHHLSVQGRLEESGQALTGAVTSTLAIYDLPSGGTELWSEVDVLTPDSNGNFVTTLGDGTPLTITDFNQDLYLGIDPGSGELSPRIPLKAAPYALRSASSAGNPLPFTGSPQTINFSSPADTTAKVVTPTSSIVFLDRSADEEVCIIRIEPWDGIQNGDVVRFITANPPGETKQFSFVEEISYINNTFECLGVTSPTCANVSGCNIKVRSNQDDRHARRVTDPDAVARFVYADGFFWDDNP